MKILIIEDEKALAEDISQYLSSQNYICETANSYQNAISKINFYFYDCILLDIMLPDGNGLNLLQEIIKNKHHGGSIIISAKNSIDDKVTGLNIGADDYLAKPFHLSELAARILSICRRRLQLNESSAIYNEFEVNILARTLNVFGKEVILTKSEFDLFLLFFSNRNKVISKSAIAEHLSGDLADMLDNHNFIYAHIKNLKRKLAEAGGDNYITTVYATGYKWVE